MSKGLGAPVGSVLVGTADDIARARVQRKRLGAGWRQAGMLAAAGSYALRHNLARVSEDHASARTLADAINAVRPGAVDDPSTNIVLIPTRTHPRWPHG
nr:beta-eliminating lyase-related protein [Tessaracoccus coleopterorum]